MVWFPKLPVIFCSSKSQSWFIYTRCSIVHSGDWLQSSYSEELQFVEVVGLHQSQETDKRRSVSLELQLNTDWASSVCVHQLSLLCCLRSFTGAWILAAHDLGKSSLWAIADSTEEEKEEGNDDLTVWQQHIPFRRVCGWDDLCMLVCSMCMFVVSVINTYSTYWHNTCLRK